VANPRRYLLPTERLVIEVRRHWAILVIDTLQSLGLLLVGILAVRIFPEGFPRTLAVYFAVFVVVRWVWIIGDWWVEKLVVTDKRVLLVTGIVTRKVAIMPLIKVTDLTYNRSSLGLMFGYGEFVVETAGQDQALSRVNYIPTPEKLYIQISQLLFGGNLGEPGVLPSPGERDAELAAGRRVLRGRRWRWGGRRRRRGGGFVRRSAGPSRVEDVGPPADTLLVDRDERFGPESFDREPFGPEPFGAEPEPERTSELPRIHEPPRDRRTGFRRPRSDRDEPPTPPVADPSDD
jgi:Bacterial PH domain